MTGAKVAALPRNTEPGGKRARQGRPAARSGQRTSVSGTAAEVLSPHAGVSQRAVAETLRSTQISDEEKAWIDARLADAPKGVGVDWPLLAMQASRQFGREITRNCLYHYAERQGFVGARQKVGRPEGRQFKRKVFAARAAEENNSPAGFTPSKHNGPTLRSTRSIADAARARDIAVGCRTRGGLKHGFALADSVSDKREMAASGALSAAAMSGGAPIAPVKTKASDFFGAGQEPSGCRWIHGHPAVIGPESEYQAPSRGEASAKRSPAGAASASSPDVVGAEKGWRYCQQPTREGSLYCIEHARRAYAGGDRVADFILARPQMAAGALAALATETFGVDVTGRSVGAARAWEKRRGRA